MINDLKYFQSVLKAVAKGKKGSRDLSIEEAKRSLQYLCSGFAQDFQVSAYLTAMRFKGTNVDELVGFIQCLQEYFPDLSDVENVLNPNGPYDGRKKTLNLSVAASILASAAGARILLHSSTGLPPKKGVGASQVLDESGVPSSLEPASVAENLKDKNFAFMHSSQFSYGIEKFRKLREVLLYRTFLHTVEILQNPFNANCRVLGVAHDHFCEKFAQTAARLGSRRVLTIPGVEGSEEAPMKKVIAVAIFNGKQEEIVLDPKSYGFTEREPTAAQHARNTAFIMRQILSEQGSTTEYSLEKESVIYNAGIRLFVSEQAKNMEDAMNLATTTLESGKAIQKLNSLTGFQSQL